MRSSIWIGASIAIAAALAPAPVLGKPRKTDAARKACEKGYAEARKLEGEGQLGAAEKLLKKCAVPTCGAFLERQCSARYSMVDADIPSVVPIAIDGQGEPIVDVEVTMDDERLVNELNGRAIRVDPGLHQFTFKRASDGHVVRRSVLVAQGQRNLRIEVTMSSAGETKVRSKPAPPAEPPPAEPPPAEPPPPVAAASERAATPVQERADPPAPARRFERRHRSTVPAYLMLATGMVGVGGYGLLTYWGRTDNAKLADCTPNCSPASVEHIKRLYLGANISLGVGAVALVTGVLLRWRASSTYQVEVQPNKGGGLATLSRAF